MNFGCTHLQIKKKYSSAIWKVDLEPLIAFALDANEDNSTRGVTVFGNPYTLRVFLKSGSDVTEISFIDLAVSGVDGYNLQLGNHVTKRSDLKNVQWQPLLVKIGDLKHQPYRLTGMIHISDTGGGDRSYSLDVDFKTDYSRERINPLWNALMSI